MGLAAEYCCSFQLVPGRAFDASSRTAGFTASPSADVSERALTVLVKSGRVLPRRGCGSSESMEMCYVWPQAAQLGVGNQGCLSSAPALLCPVATEALRAEFSFTSTQRWGILNRSMLNFSWVAVPQNCPLGT